MRALYVLVSLTRGGSVAQGQGIAHLPTIVRRESEADVEAEFTSALRQNPKDAETRAAYALWLQKGNRLLEAETELRAAVQTKPDDAGLRTAFAEFLALHSQKAEEEYLEGLRHCPKSARLRASYARFLVVHQQQDSKALDEYEQGAALADPQEDPAAFGELLAQYGTLITRTHGRGRSSLARAEKQFVRAVSDAPSAQSEHRYAAFLRFDKKDYRLAEQAYERALELDREFPLALCGYATLLDKVRGDHDRAEQLYARAAPQGECLAAYAGFLRRVRKDFVQMADLVTSDAGRDDPKLQDPEWDNARVWHRLNADGQLGGGIRECAAAGADSVRVLACVLLYIAHYIGGGLR